MQLGVGQYPGVTSVCHDPKAVEPDHSHPMHDHCHKSGAAAPSLTLTLTLT